MHTEDRRQREWHCEGLTVVSEHATRYRRSWPWIDGQIPARSGLETRPVPDQRPETGSDQPSKWRIREPCDAENGPRDALNSRRKLGSLCEELSDSPDSSRVSSERLLTRGDEEFSAAEERLTEPNVGERSYANDADGPPRREESKLKNEGRRVGAMLRTMACSRRDEDNDPLASVRGRTRTTPCPMLAGDPRRQSDSADKTHVTLVRAKDRNSFNAVSHRRADQVVEAAEQ